MDDALDEDLADGVAGGLDVEGAEFGHHVFGDRDRFAGGLQQTRRLVGRFAVAGDDDRAGDGGGGQLFGVFQDYVGIAAVGAAGQQDDIGGQGLDLGDIALGQAMGKGPRQLGPGAQGGLLGGFGGQFLDQADGDHAEPPGGAGAGEPVLEVRQRADPAFQVAERLGQSAGDVGRHRRRTLPGADDFAFFQIDGAEFGER